jgi:arylsulfatase A-like enzyme
MIRWPGKIQPGQVSNEMFSGLDWFLTLLAAAGDTTVRDRLLQGWAPTTGGATFKVHLDGYNQLPYLTGQQQKGARTEFAYYDDDGLLVAFRHGDWKAVFAEQKSLAASRFGTSRWSLTAFPSSSTCAWTRTSGPTLSPTSTTTGESRTPT